MGDAAAYAHVAMRDAIADAGLGRWNRCSHLRTGLIAGSGGGSAQWQVEAADLLRDAWRAQGRSVHGAAHDVLRRCRPTLATAYRDQGRQLFDRGRLRDVGALHRRRRRPDPSGRQDLMFAGGGEELHWTMSAAVRRDGRAVDQAQRRSRAASRPYDADRDGFVIAGGGGMLVLEDWDHAVARGARIHAGTGRLWRHLRRCRHGRAVAAKARCAACAWRWKACRRRSTTSTRTAPRRRSATWSSWTRCARPSATRVPPLSSTKALSGHSLGAASVHEAIYCLLMMRDGFIAGSANIDTLDPRAEGFPIVRESASIASSTR